MVEGVRRDGEFIGRIGPLREFCWRGLTVLRRSWDRQNTIVENRSVGFRALDLRGGFLFPAACRQRWISRWWNRIFGALVRGRRRRIITTRLRSVRLCASDTQRSSNGKRNRANASEHLEHGVALSSYFGIQNVETTQWFSLRTRLGPSLSVRSSPEAVSSNPAFDFLRFISTH